MPSTVTLAMRLLRRHAHRSARLIGGDALFHLWSEMADQALDRPGGGVAQRTDRVTLDLPRDLVQRIDLADFGPTRHHARHHAPHPPSTFTARRALAAAFVHVKF